MNALGIIKRNDSVGDVHSNEGPVDFQVNRNQQESLSEQVHLARTIIIRGLEEQYTENHKTKPYPSAPSKNPSLKWPFTPPLFQHIPYMPLTRSLQAGTKVHLQH